MLFDLNGIPEENILLQLWQRRQRKMPTSETNKALVQRMVEEL